MALLGDGPHQVLKIKTTLGDDKLLVLRMEGREYLGRMPEYKVDLVGNVNMLGTGEDIDFDKILGTRATVTMELAGDDEPRHFNAFVVRMQRGERHGRYESFTAHLRPWLFFLTLRKTSSPRSSASTAAPSTRSASRRPCRSSTTASSTTSPTSPSSAACSRRRGSATSSSTPTASTRW
jgi:hypothetical protein